MGCPASIGPEIILHFFSDSPFDADVLPVVLGDITVLEKCARDLGHKDLKIVPWNVGQDRPLLKKNTVPVLPLSSLSESDIIWGKPNVATGKAMAEYITEGVKLAQAGVLDGITTCPISKYALNQAGYAYPGHTEMLAKLTNTKNYAMMMAGDRLRVTLVTIHCPLANVAGTLTRQSIVQLIETTHQALTVDFGISVPKIAVAALNPHGGENLLFGREEKDIICPAIVEASAMGFDIHGPFPPDTVFYKASQGDYDAVVCMYHDQGLIPFKLLHFEDGVNVTLGLPIVRTSVDHGTAYDIAGRGIASSSSLSAAVTLAGSIAKNRKVNATTQRKS
ncbi:4-hydroxythreonine-4-phosphate dehydrogenase PdxA [Desulforhopalus sp. IMCC35007]|nr:4-hydroxythreonine-4-phosphate dehydrogenase PdxA [Desulforhopalus sp. IMCC35007]